jgi:hypothetical protein
MESATPLRQSFEAADKLPDELSASNGVGTSRFAMMGDQSLRKGLKVKSILVFYVGIANAGSIFLLNGMALPYGSPSLNVA